MTRKLRNPVLYAVLSAMLLASAAGIGYALAAQPRMEAAVRALENAKRELQAAEHDKAGHREKALKLVDDAIGEVRAGIQAGK